MDIRLISTDLDGTLLGEDRRVSEKNARALRACEARGIRVALVSGRCFESLAKTARDIGLCGPIISTNGTRVDASPDGPTIMEDVFSRRDADTLCALLMESGLYFVVYGRGVMYEMNLGLHPEETGDAKMMRIANETANGCHVDILADENAALETGLNRTLKFIAYGVAPEQMEPMRRALEATGLCSVNSSWHDNLEVMPLGSGKGRALRVLTAHLGLVPEQVMAFGDNLNDLEMLLASGWPVAMGNAVPELKRAAKIIAPSNDRSGVGCVIDENILLGAAV